MAKRKINIGLRKYNAIRSTISHIYKDNGQKLDRKTLDQYTKETYSDSKDVPGFPDVDQVKTYLRMFGADIPEEPIQELEPESDVYNPYNYNTAFNWFDIASEVGNLPKGLNVWVDAGDAGQALFNTSNYDYNAHLKEIYDQLNAFQRRNKKVYPSFYLTKVIKDGITYLKYTLFRDDEPWDGTEALDESEIGDRPDTITPEDIEKAKEITKEAPSKVVPGKEQPSDLEDAKKREELETFKVKEETERTRLREEGKRETITTKKAAILAKIETLKSLKEVAVGDAELEAEIRAELRDLMKQIKDLDK